METIEHTFSDENHPNGIPKCGQRVNVTMNNIGTATVMSLFVMEGFLGLEVELDKPPAWWIKQNGTANKIAHVFGSECRSLPVPERLTEKDVALLSSASESIDDDENSVYVDPVGSPNTITLPLIEEVQDDDGEVDGYWVTTRQWMTPDDLGIEEN